MHFFLKFSLPNFLTFLKSVHTEHYVLLVFVVLLRLSLVFHHTLLS